ncbi:hypothetical protein D3C81_877680 [compost metagenome]
MEVQQADALVQPGITETLDHGNQLRGRQTELGLLAPGIGPLARCQRRQAHAQAYLRLDLQLGGLVDHQGDLGFLLDDDEHVVAKLLAHQRQANELTVLVTVADDGPALGRQCQHGQQLGLGAGFQANRHILRGDDVLHHRFLLVDLDRVQRGVLALVLQTRDVGIERARQLAYAVLQNVRETDQQRQRKAALTQLVDLLEEVDRRALGPIGAHFDAPGFIDGEITSAPMADTINTAAVGHGPLATIVFACASYGHSSPL